MAGLCRLAIFMVLVTGLLFACQVHGQIVSQCPMNGDTKANTDSSRFTAVGCCDQGDFVYGVMFNANDLSTQVASGVPGPGDPGGSDGTWILRFNPALTDSQNYTMRVIGWMTNESQDTPFMCGGTSACSNGPNCKFFKKAKAVSPGGGVKMDPITADSFSTTGNCKFVLISGVVNKDPIAMAHVEISRIVDDSRGGRRVEMVKPPPQMQKTPGQGKNAVRAQYEITGLKSGDIYKVRLTASERPRANAFKDFDVQFLTIP